METGTIGGYLIEHRAVLHPLVEALKGQGTVSELELYEYLIVHANYSDKPRRRNVVGGVGFVMEHKGQTAVSAQTIADYFSKEKPKIQRNTITKKLNSLADKGFIRIISNPKNPKNGNAYEIVNYGDVTGTFEVLSNREDTDYTREEGEFCSSEMSNRLSNRNEQPIEQPKTQKVEQPKSIDIFSENGNFLQSVEQPKKEITFEGTTQKVKQHNINNYVNNDNIDYTTTQSLSYTREEKICDSVIRDKSFWNKLKNTYNINQDDIDKQFDIFWKYQLENNEWHSSKLVFERCFRAWFDNILEKNFGAEIVETFKDFKTAPKRLKNPMRLLTPKLKREFADNLGMNQEAFEQSLSNYLNSGMIDDYRFTDFKEEKDKLFQYIASEPQNLPF